MTCEWRGWGCIKNPCKEEAKVFMEGQNVEGQRHTWSLCTEHAEQIRKLYPMMDFTFQPYSSEEERQIANL